MFTFNVHDLLDNKERKISVGESIEDTYNLWLEHFKKTGQAPNIFDAFVAGYTIGNNAMLKEKVLRIKSTNRLIEKTFGGRKR